jgi:hypothetical protein
MFAHSLTCHYSQLWLCISISSSQLVAPCCALDREPQSGKARRIAVDRSGSHRDPSSWSGGRPDHFGLGWRPRRRTATDRTRSFRARLLHLDRHGWRRAGQATHWVPRRGGWSCSSARVASTQYIIHILSRCPLARPPSSARYTVCAVGVLDRCWSRTGRVLAAGRGRDRAAGTFCAQLRGCSNSCFNMDIPLSIPPWRF